MNCTTHLFSSVQLSPSVMSYSLQLHGLQHPRLPDITNSWSLFKFMSIKLVMPSNHLILCRPLLLLPPGFFLVFFSIFPYILTSVHFLIPYCSCLFGSLLDLELLESRSHFFCIPISWDNIIPGTELFLNAYTREKL